MVRKLKINNDRVIDELLKIDKMIFLDILSTFYNDVNISNIGKYIPNGLGISPIITEAHRRIVNKIMNYKEILSQIQINITEYIITSEFLNLDETELLEICKDSFRYPTAGNGVNAEHLLLYYYSKNKYQGEIIEKLKKVYIDSLQEVENYHKNFKDIELNGLKNSEIETVFNEIFFENNLHISYYEKDFKELAEKFGAEYDEEKKVVNNLRRGVLFFLEYKLTDVVEAEKNNNFYYNKIIENSLRIDVAREKLTSKIQEFNKIKIENEEVKRKNRLFSKHIKELEKIEKTVVITNNESELKSLSKENYYLKTRIEELEKHIAELEEEKTINQEIAENIKIEDKIIELKREIPEYKNIIVLGGNWNSKSKSEVEELLINNSIEFIEADRTIRSFDKIRNADIVIFDTSKNAHKYYYKVKNIECKLLFISKSNLEEVKKIFEG